MAGACPHHQQRQPVGSWRLDERGGVLRTMHPGRLGRFSRVARLVATGRARFDQRAAENRAAELPWSYHQAVATLDLKEQRVLLQCD